MSDGLIQIPCEQDMPTKPWLAASTQSFPTEFYLAGLSAAVHFDLN